MDKTVIVEDQAGQISSGPTRCLCPKCVEVRSRAIKLPDTFLRGDEVHHSGTIIHWDWRDPAKRKELILITCHFCGHDSFVRKQSILRRWEGERGWRGLCSTDAQLPARRTLKGIYTGNPFGAIIDFEKAPHDHNRAWVYCPNYSTCGGLEQRRVDKYNMDTQPFYCEKCLGETRSANLKKAWAALKGSGQKNTHGGARRVDWTPERRAAFLACYEEILQKVQKQDDSLPEGVRKQASLKGNKPCEVARDYTAQLLGVTPSDYLQRVLAVARRERAGV